MKKITDEQFYDLLSRKLSGDAVSEELELLREQLLINPQWQFMYDQVMKQSLSATSEEEQVQQAYAAHFVKMQLLGRFEEQKVDEPVAQELYIDDKISSPSLFRRRLYPLLAAASLAAIFFCVYYFSIKQPKMPLPGNALNEIATRKGSKSTIKLPDGTQVWLNADSRLTYGEQFIGKTREVTLSGEAYFDVAHDTSRPFIIHTGSANIKVLGTAFNVRNYPNDKTWETTLMRGKIEVSFNGRPDEKIILKPLDKLIIIKDDQKSSDSVIFSSKPHGKVTLTAVNYLRRDSLVAETSWINGKLIFINEPLSKIAEEMERQFAVAIIFKREDVKNYRYTGDFEKESLEKILQILSLSKKINYSVSDSTVLIE
ncbi:MAG: FecR family protein [Chitinophagaceae bacterium]